MRRRPPGCLITFAGMSGLLPAAPMPAVSRNSSRASWSASPFRGWKPCDMQQPPVWTEADLKAAAARGQFCAESMFGIDQVAPVAMLSGVLKVSNLVKAHGEGLTMFWAHRLDAMRSFIEATR